VPVVLKELGAEQLSNRFLKANVGPGIAVSGRLAPELVSLLRVALTSTLTSPEVLARDICNVAVPSIVSRVPSTVLGLLRDDEKIYLSFSHASLPPDVLI
jgi:hypothetical protein